MEHDLLFRRERVQLTAELVQITAYDPCAFPLCPLEQGVLRKVGDSAVETTLVPCPAFDCQ